MKRIRKSFIAFALAGIFTLPFSPLAAAADDMNDAPVTAESLSEANRSDRDRIAAAYLALFEDKRQKSAATVSIDTPLADIDCEGEIHLQKDDDATRSKIELAYEIEPKAFMGDKKDIISGSVLLYSIDDAETSTAYYITSFGKTEDQTWKKMSTPLSEAGDAIKQWQTMTEQYKQDFSTTIKDVKTISDSERETTYEITVDGEKSGRLLQEMIGTLLSVADTAASQKAKKQGGKLKKKDAAPALSNEELLAVTGKILREFPDYTSTVVYSKETNRILSDSTDFSFVVQRLIQAGIRQAPPQYRDKTGFLAFFIDSSKVRIKNTYGTLGADEVIEIPQEVIDNAVEAPIPLPETKL
ncbi:hypothetical protein TAMA11512_20330 [Selenomonas sp. TAMA-11512]|uniref:hypothetical protein n=1 Tax=Selenomonas sp. TAMA-11512 TaxID=3095337 RepID=UPI003090EE77|nr:hypothetical protein TAMA11512_20330 [Selenomonas sp. TAMA-11512]